MQGQTCLSMFTVIYSPGCAPKPLNEGRVDHTGRSLGLVFLRHTDILIPFVFVSNLDLECGESEEKSLGHWQIRCLPASCETCWTLESTRKRPTLPGIRKQSSGFRRWMHSDGLTYTRPSPDKMFKTCAPCLRLSIEHHRVSSVK